MIIGVPLSISLRITALLIVSHFLACAFAWNPKTNRYVLELTVSTLVLLYCTAYMVMWIYLLSTSTFVEGSLNWLHTHFATLDRITSRGIIILWTAVTANFVWNHARPRTRDFFGTAVALTLSGILLAHTISIPASVENLYYDLYPREFPN
ncbi:MAG: hypothetical protein P1V20_21540 [Verrucomicrobiales bacterium]|nr:hypothetical protein [Verrucomicrobiales bacterium]